MSLRIVCCNLGNWVTIRSPQRHVRGKVWLEGELSRAPEARARKNSRFWMDTWKNVSQIRPKCAASLQFSFISKFIFEAPFFQLHFNFTLKFIFLKTLCFASYQNFFSKIGHFPCFTSRFTSAPHLCQLSCVDFCCRIRLYKTISLLLESHRLWGCRIARL